MPAPRKSEPRSRNRFARFFTKEEKRAKRRNDAYASEVQERLHEKGPGAVKGGKLPEPPKPTNRMSMEDLEREAARKKQRKMRKREKKRAQGGGGGSGY